VLLVARNEASTTGDSFYFVSPKNEPRLSSIGQFRIDAQAALPISTESVQEDLFALKAVYKGGLLGAELLRRIQTMSVIPLGEQLKRHGLRFSSGFQLGQPVRRTRSAKHLLGLPIARPDMSFEVSGHGAEVFAHQEVQWPRAPGVFKGPLILFRESPHSDRSQRGALFCESDTAYSESFLGLSVAGLPELRPVMNLLYVLSYSDLLLYFHLLTSPKFGVERDSILQSDLERFPLVDPERLTHEQRAAVDALAVRLRRRELCWDEVDRIVFDIYDLASWDRQLVQDTLQSELPFNASTEESNRPTTTQERAVFADAFNSLVEPFIESEGQPTRILSEDDYGSSGWRYVQIGRQSGLDSTLLAMASRESSQLTAVADTYWASRVTVHLPDGSARVGYLDQRRYWTKTQARLLALEWLQGDGSLE
jgi:hypothetical protein